MKHDAASPDGKACCEEQLDWTADPCWASEAVVKRQAEDAMEFAGLVPDPPILPDGMDSAIAKVVEIENWELTLITLAVYDELVRRKIVRLVAPDLLEAFITLRHISQKLSEVAEELRGASFDLQRLLHLAYSSSGKRGMECGLQSLFDPLMPKDREWCTAQVEERLAGITEDHALEMIEAVHGPMLMLLELEPKRARGSRGRTSRNAVIRELAKAYQNVLGEAPTCTPTGRFMLLCQLMFDALGVDTKGLESAVQRVLRELRTD